MTDRKTYRATAEREGAWWVLRVPEINSATQARRLEQAEAMVRDLVQAITDGAPDSFDVDVRPQLAPDLMELVLRATAASGRARVQQLEASITTRKAAEALARTGMTVRDVGRLLGVSYQRVQQLLADDTEPVVLQQRLEAELGRLDEPRTQVDSVERSAMRAGAQRG